MKKKYLIITLLFLILGCDEIKKEEKVKVDEKSKFLISEKELKEFTIFAIHLGKAFNEELPVFRRATEMTNIRLKGVASRNRN